jgi:hypothetical protein
MGRIACPEHGLSGIAFGCPHVKAAVLAKTPVPAHDPYSIHIDGDVVLVVAVCGPCAGERGLQRSIAWEDYERGPELGEPICSSCFAATRT